MLNLRKEYNTKGDIIMGFEKLSLSDIKFSDTGYGSLKKSSSSKSKKPEATADYEPLLKFSKASTKVSKKRKAQKSESASAMPEKTVAPKRRKTKGKVSKGQGKITQADEELYNSMDPLIIGKYKENGYSKKQMIDAYRHYLEVDEPAMRKADEKKYNVRASNGMTYEEAMTIIRKTRAKHYGEFKYFKARQDCYSAFDNEKMEKDDPAYAAALKARKELEEKHPEVKSMYVQKYGVLLS